MTKYWLAGVAALTMISGSAFAQDSTTDSTSSQSTVSTPAPVAGSYSASKSEKTTDSDGVQTDKSQHYSSDAAGTKSSTSSETTMPSAPAVDTTTTNHSSTTTTNQ